MEIEIINAYYKEVPAVICTAGSHIAAKNLSARRIIGSHRVSDILYDMMEGVDVLKFEACFSKADSNTSLVFPLRGFEGFRYAIAVFDVLFSRCFSVVFFFGHLPESDEIARLFEVTDRPEPELLSEFMKIFFEIPEDNRENENAQSIADLDLFTSAAVARFKMKFGYSITYSYIDEAPDECSYAVRSFDLPVYLQMMFYLLSSAEALSSEKRAEISMINRRESVELQIRVVADLTRKEFSSVEDAAEMFPYFGECIFYCRSVSDLYDGAPAVFAECKSKLFTARIRVKKHRVDNVDFKSRDPLCDFDNIYERVIFIAQYLDSRDAKKQG